MASLTPEQQAAIEEFRRTAAKDFAENLNRNAIRAHEERMKRLKQKPEAPPEV